MTKFVSCLFLLAQGIILMDFSYDLHDVLMLKADENERLHGENASNIWYYILHRPLVSILQVLTHSFIRYFVYILLCIVSLIVVGLLSTYIFLDYANCPTATWFVSITLAVGCVTTLISLLNSVNRGLLTPSLMFAYSTLMTWFTFF